MKKNIILSCIARFSKKAVATLGLVSVLAASPVLAQEESSEEDKFNMKVTLNSDIFFGFYPFFGGSYKLSDKLDFTFYGILWSGGTGASWGNWTEFGVGVGLPVGDALYINPQIGLLNGSLTSGLGTPVLGEGLVPNLTVGLNKNKLEGELYAGYYLGLKHTAPQTNNYLHYWLNGGYKIASFVSAGLHLEQLRFMGGMEPEGVTAREAVDLYFSVGPYVQFSDPKGKSFARFTTGWDLRSEEQVTKSENTQPSFFKLTAGYNF
jgi:hypothetical protein